MSILVASDPEPDLVPNVRIRSKKAGAGTLLIILKSKTFLLLFSLKIRKIFPVKRNYFSYRLVSNHVCFLPSKSYTGSFFDEQF
jgi:hypothetical protein